MKHHCEGRDQDVDSADRVGEAKGLGGLATVVVIRRRWPTRRVFFLTGDPSETIAAAARAWGMEAHAAKSRPRPAVEGPVCALLEDMLGRR